MNGSNHQLVDRQDSELLPLVSVIMPVRNEECHIERSISSVLKQSYPQERMELIAADGMSSDGTRQVIQRFQAQHRNLRLVDNPQRIVATGLNAATALARGTVIIRVDGHCEIDRDYVRRCVEYLREEGVVGVGGPIETVGETLVARTIAVAMSSRFGVGNSTFRTVNDRTCLVDTVPFPAYDLAAIHRAGPYDEELIRNQDDEYNYRLRKLGGKLLLAADVRSRYYSRTTLWALARQYFQYGFWKVRVTQKHPRQMRPRQFVPVCFVLVLLFALAFAPFSSLSRWLLCILVASYLATSIVAALITSWRDDWRTMVLLPSVFSILHLSYGVGFLAGLVAFCNRWDLPKKGLSRTAAS